MKVNEKKSVSYQIELTKEETKDLVQQLQILLGRHVKREDVVMVGRLLDALRVAHTTLRKDNSE